MLRTPHLPHLTSPAFLCNTLRISLFSSLSFTSFKSPNPLTSFSPQLPSLPKTSVPISPSLLSPSSKWAPPTGGHLRSRRTEGFTGDFGLRCTNSRWVFLFLGVIVALEHLVILHGSTLFLLCLGFAQEEDVGAPAQTHIFYSPVSFSVGSNGGESKEILVQHLLVGEDNLKLLLELQQRIAGGEDLSDLAVEYSICPSKEQGGMLGWVQKGQMVPEFEEAAFAAPLNKVVRCKTKFGWHLLQVLSERVESLLQDIQPEKLHSKMKDPSFFEEAQLIDVREPDEVAQASLPGFKVLPLRQFGSWGPEITNEFDPQKDTYVLCHHGMRSLQVAKWLQTQGFKRIFNVAGGIHAYAVIADASIPTY